MGGAFWAHGCNTRNNFQFYTVPVDADSEKWCNLNEFVLCYTIFFKILVRKWWNIGNIVVCYTVSPIPELKSGGKQGNKAEIYTYFRERNGGIMSRGVSYSTFF